MPDGAGRNCPLHGWTSSPRRPEHLVMADPPTPVPRQCPPRKNSLSASGDVDAASSCTGPVKGKSKLPHLLLLLRSSDFESACKSALLWGCKFSPEKSTCFMFILRVMCIFELRELLACIYYSKENLCLETIHIHGLYIYIENNL